jgi:hypothetical protein
MAMRFVGTTPLSSRVATGSAFLALGAIAACGGGSTGASSGPDEEVASLEEGTSDGDPSGTDAAGEDATLAADEAALEFSQCLRDEGLDVPDIGVDANGNIELRDAFESIDRSDDTFRDAMESCRELLGDGGFGGGRGAQRDSTEFADALLAVSDCVRAEGFEDVDDLTLGQPGGNAGQGGGEDAPEDGAQPPGRGQGQGGFGDRTTGIAIQLGLDPEDPAVIDVMETCLPILENALADAGIGQPGTAESD